jgi:hypothetical protein
MTVTWLGGLPKRPADVERVEARTIPRFGHNRRFWRVAGVVRLRSTLTGTHQRGREWMRTVAGVSAVPLWFGFTIVERVLKV